MTLKPEHFKIDIMEEAHQLRMSALAQSSTHQLDPKTAFWVVTTHAWYELCRAADIYAIQIRPDRRKELMGLPVRVTVGDEPDVPMIQLVMEPKIQPKEAKK